MYIRRLTLVIVIIVTIIADRCDCCFGNVVTFDVKHKFASKPQNLSDMRARDMIRHARLLSCVNVDIPLGGNAQYGLYFAKLRIGNPSQDYHVHVDTGVDFSWVDCVNCKKCAQKSYLGIKLNKYDPTKSSTSSLIYCHEQFCTSVNDGSESHGEVPKCMSGQVCRYNATYPDTSGSTGHLVKDIVQLQQVTGNLQTGAMNGTVVFGCGFTRKYGASNITEGDVDGVLGFGQGSSSIISQLALEEKVKRKFSHCLNYEKGGGIFAIGNVEEPAQMNKTSMIMQQYQIELKEMQVGDHKITLSRRGGSMAVNLDMGSSLAYLPNKIHKQVIKMITHRPSVKPEIVDNFTCFTFDKNVDQEFPAIKFSFADSLILTVYPRDYLFKNNDNKQCIGWLRSEQNDEGSHILLGDMVLANKLVIYDIENQTIGWTEYNCSTNIVMKEENSEKHTVGAHNISSASSFSIVEIFILLSVLIIALHFPVA